ncbi:MAG: hypothetical protein SV253_02005 [Halobacteria archaeon]|nr:hypothetical protein [Halobacteria archaeon]
MDVTDITRRIRFGHVTLILGFVGAAVSYSQTAPTELNESTVSLSVFAWTLIATWVSVEFYKGKLVEEKEDLKRWNEDWRATVIDYRNENQELQAENEELRDSIKEITRENHELKQRLDDQDAVGDASEDGETSESDDAEAIE